VPLDVSFAAQRNWNGSASTDWFDPNNWTPAVLPDVPDDALIDIVTPVIVEAQPADILNLFIGSSLAGEVMIQNGGSIQAGADVNIGVNTSGSLTVSGTGSLLSSSNALFVGYYGSGSLEVLDGGTLNSHYSSIGTYSGSTGTVLVSGTGSTWSYTDYLFIGNQSAGSLTVADGGEVSGPYAHIGVAAGSTGDVTVTGTGSKLSLTNQLYVGDGGSGTLTIADGGAVSVAGAGVVRIADQGTASGVINIGAAEGQAAAAAGTLDAATVSFGAGTGELVFNHTDVSGSYLFDEVISGAGTLKFRSGVTRLTGTSAAFTGSTSITGSTLILDGDLGASAVLVGSAGYLSGSGSAGAVTVAAGGTLTPSSFSTMTLQDVTFDPGSRYEIAANSAGQNGSVAVTGTAQINGGTVHVRAAPGAYAATTPYTILSAGSVVASFDDVTTDLAFLTPDLSYDAGNVFLTLTRNMTQFADVALSSNQRSAAGGVEGLGAGNPVHDAVLNLDASSARGAFDALSGEMHASLRGTLVESTRMAQGVIGNRLRQTFTVVSSLDGRAAAGPGDTLGTSGFGLSVWGAGFGGRSHNEATSNSDRVESRSAGFILGADAPLGEYWRAGLAAGYSDSRANGGRAASSETGSYHLIGYAGGSVAGWGIRLGAEHTWHDIDTTRNVVFPGFSETVISDHEARTAQVFGEAGYPVVMGRVTVEPFAGLGAVHHTTEGFAEGGGASALTVNGDTMTVLFSSLGLRASSDVHIGLSHTLTLSAGSAWRHASGDLNPVSVMRFESGTPFTTQGTAIARNALALEAGASLQLTERATLSLDYFGQIAERAQEHAAKGQFSLQF
jgi:outer membrane autotransporter protein